MAAAVPEIDLQYVCGCRDVWQVSDLGGQEQTMLCAQPCVPEQCQTCEAHGRPCPTRQAMGTAYTPVEFTEIRPKRYTRMRSK